MFTTTSAATTTTSALTNSAPTTLAREQPLAIFTVRSRSTAAPATPAAERSPGTSAAYALDWHWQRGSVVDRAQLAEANLCPTCHGRNP